VLLLTEVGWQVFGVVWIILNSSKSDLLVQGFIIGKSSLLQSVYVLKLSLIWGPCIFMSVLSNPQAACGPPDDLK